MKRYELRYIIDFVLMIIAECTMLWTALTRCSDTLFWISTVVVLISGYATWLNGRRLGIKFFM